MLVDSLALARAFGASAGAAAGLAAGGAAFATGAGAGSGAATAAGKLASATAGSLCVGVEADLFRLQHEAQHGADVVFAGGGEQRHVQTVFRLMRVFNLAEVAQLFQHQGDFTGFQPVQADAHAAFDRRRRSRRLHDRLLNGRLSRRRLLLLLRLQRQLAQRLANVFKAFGIRLLRGFIGVQLLLHNVFGFQKQVDNLGAQAHFLASCTVQQVLQQVGRFLQHRKAKGRRTTLDRVRRAEDGV